MEPENTQNSLTDKQTTEMLQALYEDVVKRLISGVSTQTIIRSYVEQGADEKFIRRLIERAKDDIYEHKRRKGFKNLGFGALWFVGGTVVTIATYSAASGGGRYVVAWGAILFGFIQMVSGLVQLLGNRRING